MTKIEVQYTVDMLTQLSLKEDLSVQIIDTNGNVFFI
jgi:hypothetical protein